MRDRSNALLSRAAVLLALAAATASASHPLAAPGVTSLTNVQVQFQVTDKPCVVLERGAVRTVVVGNAAVDTPDLPGHRDGYNGLAILEHDRRKENLFVPSVAGLNFEHIHDGTRAGLKEPFEPRIDDTTPVGGLVVAVRSAAMRPACRESALLPGRR